MLIEICKGLWLIPYEITEICLEKNGDGELTVVCIISRQSPSLLTTKRYDLGDEVAALEEAKRVAELVNKACYELPPSPNFVDVLTVANRLDESHGTISESWTNAEVAKFVFDAYKEGK